MLCRTALPLVALLLALPTPVLADPAPALHGDAARPAQAQWLRSEMYFAIGRWDAASKVDDEARWQRFLDEEVTPRFPQGFTVLQAYGQWQPRAGDAVERLNSRVVVLLHDNTAASLARLDALRSAWKRISGDDSVLRAMQVVEVSF